MHGIFTYILVGKYTSPMDPMGIYLPTCITNMLSYLGSTSHARMTKASKMLGGKGVDPN